MSNPYNFTDKRIGSTALQPRRTYTIPSKEPFYTALPTEFKNYYMWFVREWFRWYDGYVDGFHNHGKHGIFSTRIAYKIAHKFAKQIMGGKLLYEEEDGAQEQKDKIIKVLGRSKFDNKLQQAFEWALAGGDSILKADVYKRGNLTISPLRKDEYFVDTDFNGNITKFSGLVDNKVKTTKVQGNEEKDNYFLMEERRYNPKTQAPEYRLTIKHGMADGVNYKKGDFHSADVNFKDLPNKIRDEFKNEFDGVMFGEWEEMPLDSLGVYMIKASNGTSFAPSLPFGESIFSGMIHLLMSYDFYYTSKMTDIYLGRGKVMIPDFMRSPHENTDIDFSEFQEMVYTKLPYMEPEKQQPTPIQFDLRSQDWTAIRNDLLQEMAMHLNLSPRTLASFAVPASEKPTAHEINVDQDDTALTIEFMRKLNEGTINDLIDCVATYYDYEPEKIHVKFSKMGLMNMSTMVNQISMLVDRNLIDDRTALEYVFPDKTDKEIEKIIERKKEEKEKKTENNVPDPNDKELQNMEKETFDNQVTHTENPPEEE